MFNYFYHALNQSAKSSLRRWKMHLESVHGERVRLHRSRRLLQKTAGRWARNPIPYPLYP